MMGLVNHGGLLLVFVMYTHTRHTMYSAGTHCDDAARRFHNSISRHRVVVAAAAVVRRSLPWLYGAHGDSVCTYVSLSMHDVVDVVVCVCGTRTNDVISLFAAR